MDRREFMRRGLCGAAGAALSRLFPFLKTAGTASVDPIAAWLKVQPELSCIKAWDGQAWQTFTVWSPIGK